VVLYPAPTAIKLTVIETIMKISTKVAIQLIDGKLLLIT
jgi:hypothetical protein